MAFYGDSVMPFDGVNVQAGEEEGGVIISGRGTLLDSGYVGEDGDHWNVLHTITLLNTGIRLALHERDIILQHYERMLNAIQPRQQPTRPVDITTMNTRESTSRNMPNDVRKDATTTMSTSANNHLLLKNDLADSIAMSSPKLSNRETEVNSRHLGGLAGADASKPIPSPKFNACFNLAEMYVEPVDDEGSEFSTTWEYKTVTISRVPGFGFGIAVSGGKDNPHFKSGDPSIVVSDVLRAGPAWGLLQLNDRIVSANGVGLEHADYDTAVQIMKENEQLNLVVKRRVPLPVPEFEQRHLKFTLTKSRRKDDFGIVLGCKFYIKGITNKKLAEKEPGLKPGDVVMKINGQDCDELTLGEARKLLEKSKERLSLIIQRDVPRGTAWKWPSQATLYERLGPGDTPRQSPIPRLSPMVSSRYSESGEPARLNNAVRLSGRMGRLTSSEYCPSPKRHSLGSQPPSRSRTPSQSVYDDYSNFSPRGSLPQTPPPRLTGEDSAHLSVGPHGESPVLHKPPLPSPHPEARFICFTKESGSVGVRVIGGNEMGIFVSAVQAGSPAAMKGVRPGDKILRVNNKDMRGVTREESVLFLLGLQDQVDLVVQWRKDEYERIRAQNLGDNFYIRTHFDYEKPEEGEIGFRKGDIYQITDTLFGGTVGSWQAVRVSSPSSSLEKVTPSDSPQAKGVIPNASRAEQILNAEQSRSSRSTGEGRTGTLLRKKVSLATRRSKSLTKGHWDEVVFAHGTVHFSAYERVKLKHPGFLRPVVLFGSLSDIAREQLLRDFPLRFASPHNDMTNSATKTIENGSGMIRLSAIREVMNKNKHCLLDVTPHSVEKLQYAQYCPIVIFISVDSRTRLRELRKKYSKAAASKNTRKLQEQATKIQKIYSYLFTAVLDASREDHWFDALRELISHLQERRVWMSECRPADLLDDDFLFPMANSRVSANCAGDSDMDSVRGDGDYGAVNGPCDGRVNESMDSAAYTSSHGTRASCEPSERSAPLSQTNGLSTSEWRSTSETSAEVYANRDALINHIATLPRPVPDSKRTKPRPPPRYPQYPTLPPKPAIPPAVPNSAVPSNAPKVLDRENPDPVSTYQASSSNHSKDPAVFESLDSTVSTNQSIESSRSMPNQPIRALPTLPRGAYHGHGHPLPGRGVRHYSETGFYDVKQILADQNDDYVNRAAAVAMYENATLLNGNRSPSYYDATSRFPTGDAAFSSQRSFSPLTSTLPGGGMNGPTFPISSSHLPVNRQQQFPSASYNMPPAPMARASPVSRTVSLTTNTSTLPVYGARSYCVPSPLVGTYHRPHGTIRSPLPPPAPAPRSPHPHSPRLTSLPAGSATHSVTGPIRFMDDDTTYASLPILTNGDGQTQKTEELGERNGDHFTSSAMHPGSTILPSTSRRIDESGSMNGYNEGQHQSANSGMKNRTNGESAHTSQSADDPNDGHNVLAHVRATIGPEGGTLSSNATDVSITIPPGALTTNQEMFFKVFRDASMAPPMDESKGEALLSPLLMCGPPGLQFQKPVELKLPHCASGVNPEQWSFALKSASATRDGLPSWRQVALTDARNMQNGQISDKFVTIMLDHF